MQKKEFKNPSNEWRCSPFWSWNDQLNQKELDRQFDTIIEQGWGSAFMHLRVGNVTGYLSDKWMEYTKGSAIHAGKSNSVVWLYDEDKWPSGYAGGIVGLISKDYRNRALVLLKPNEFIPECDTVLTKYNHNGTDYLIAERLSALGNAWFNGSCYVDLMNADAVKAFLDSTHEKYKEHVGQYFGKEIQGVFTDEPCYLYRGNNYIVPYTQWSTKLADFFKKLKGYDLMANLPALFFETSNYKKVRYDFYDASSRLFVQSFTKQYYDWCNKNNLKFTGHMMAEDNLVYQIEWSGAVMPHYQYMHIPGVDKLGRNHEQLVTMVQLGSAVQQFGKQRALCETYGCIGQHSAFIERKWIGDWMAVLGINFLNPHLSLFSMRGERKRDYPCNIFYPQPWWEREKGFADYNGRLCYALSDGERQTDILIIHPISSAYMFYNPDTSHKERKLVQNRFNTPFETLSKELLAEKLDYHYGDETIMETTASVEDGKLKIGNMRYGTVIVPPSCTLSSSTIKLLKEFTTSSTPNRLIFIGETPTYINAEPSNDIPKGTHYKDITTAVKAIKDLYPLNTTIRSLNATNELDDAVNVKEIITHERKTNAGRLIFFANTDSNNAYDTRICIHDDRSPIVCDLMTGEYYVCNFVRQGKKMTIDCRFEVSGSLLLLLANEDNIATNKCPRFLDSGIEFLSNSNANESAKPITAYFKRALDLNSLVINRADAVIGGKELKKNMLVVDIQHNHFYCSAEGTPFSAVYTFFSDCDIQNDVFLAIECAENLDQITLNGEKVMPLKTRGEQLFFDNRTWMDSSLTRVKINGIKKGENKIVISGKKSNNISDVACHVAVPNFEDHCPTEIEAVYVVGDFGVRLENNSFIICDKTNSIDYYPTYSGKFEYTIDMKSVASSKTLIVESPCACAELFDGKTSLGTKYFAPYKFDISSVKDKSNLRLVLYTTLINLTGPNWHKELLTMEYVSPWSFAKDFDNRTDKPVLKDYSLLKIWGQETPPSD